MRPGPIITEQQTPDGEWHRVTYHRQKTTEEMLMADARWYRDKMEEYRQMMCREMDDELRNERGKRLFAEAEVRFEALRNLFDAALQPEATEERPGF